MRIVFALIAALVSFQVHAQAIQQSGPITPGHAVAWTTNGVVQDAGAANFSALTEIGVTKDHGNGICQSTNILLTNYQLICIGADSGTGASINLTGSPFEPLIFTNNGFTGISISSAGVVSFPNGAVMGIAVLNVVNVTAAGPVTVGHADNVICINKTTAQSTVVTLPPAPLTGEEHRVKDCRGNAATYLVTIVPAAGTIDGRPSYILPANYAAVDLIYSGSSWGIY